MAFCSISSFLSADTCVCLFVCLFVCVTCKSYKRSDTEEHFCSSPLGYFLKAFLCWVLQHTMMSIVLSLVVSPTYFLACFHTFAFSFYYFVLETNFRMIFFCLCHLSLSPLSLLYILVTAFVYFYIKTIMNVCVRAMFSSAGTLPCTLPPSFVYSFHRCSLDQNNVKNTISISGIG